MKLYFEVKKSKDGNGKYGALCVDLGYRQAVLTYDRATIVEILGVDYATYYEFPVGYKKELCPLVTKK